MKEKIIQIYNKLSIQRLFLILVIPIGLLYMVFMLPTYAPDESAHIWKAYEVSQGIFFTRKDDNGKNYTIIPKALIDYKQETLDKYDTLKESLKQKTDYKDTTKLISPAQGYPFFLYIPEAMGLLIARIFNLNILFGIYLGKIFNFILYIVSGYFILKKLPFGKMVAFVYMLIPMILTQAVSMSADAIINILILFYIAHILQMLYKEKMTKTDKLICIILPILIAVSKIAYVPIVGLNLLLIYKKDLNKKEKIGIIWIEIFICIICALLWYVYSSKLTNANVGGYLEANNVNSTEQIKLILTHPIQLIKMLYYTTITYGKYYIDTMIGSQLGWLNILIKPEIINAFAVLLLFSPFVENNSKQLDKKQKLLLLAIAIVTIIAIITGLYIIWSGVGTLIAVGVQGRYFIPVAIILLLCMCMKENYIKIKNINIIYAIAIALLNIITCYGVYKFFI